MKQGMELPEMGNLVVEISPEIGHFVVDIFVIKVKVVVVGLKKVVDDANIVDIFQELVYNMYLLDHIGSVIPEDIVDSVEVVELLKLVLEILEIVEIVDIVEIAEIAEIVEVAEVVMVMAEMEAEILKKVAEILEVMVVVDLMAVVVPNMEDILDFRLVD